MKFPETCLLGVALVAAILPCRFAADEPKPAAVVPALAATQIADVPADALPMSTRNGSTSPWLTACPAIISSP